MSRCVFHANRQGKYQGNNDQPVIDAIASDSALDFALCIKAKGH